MNGVYKERMSNLPQDEWRRCHDSRAICSDASLMRSVRSVWDVTISMHWSSVRGRSGAFSALYSSIQDLPTIVKLIHGETDLLPHPFHMPSA